MPWVIWMQDGVTMSSSVLRTRLILRLGLAWGKRHTFYCGADHVGFMLLLRQMPVIVMVAPWWMRKVAGGSSAQWQAMWAWPEKVVPGLCEHDTTLTLLQCVLTFSIIGSLCTMKIKTRGWRNGNPEPRVGPAGGWKKQTDLGSN